MTPEGAVKKEIVEALTYLGIYPLGKPEPKGSVRTGWYFMPVQHGYGARAVDFIGSYMGRPLLIEAKAPGGSLSALQRQCLSDNAETGGISLIIKPEEGRDIVDMVIEGLKLWKRP